MVVQFFTLTTLFVLKLQQILCIRNLTRNFEIEKIPVEISSNIWGLELVQNTKFVMDVSDELLLNST